MIVTPVPPEVNPRNWVTMSRETWSVWVVDFVSMGVLSQSSRLWVTSVTNLVDNPLYIKPSLSQSRL